MPETTQTPKPNEPIPVTPEEQNNPTGFADPGVESTEEPTFTRYATDEDEANANTISFTSMRNRGEVEVTPPVDKPKAEPKPETTPKPEEEATPAEEETAPVRGRQPGQGEPRDYTGIPEEHKEMFSRMSRPAFEYMKPLYLAREQQKAELEQVKQQLAAQQSSGLPASYLQHPKGYLLSPEYNKKAHNYSVAERVLQHWQQQLVKVRRGEQWYEGELNNDGEIKKTAPKEATAEDEAQLMQLEAQARNQLMEHQLDLRTFIDRFGQTAQQEQAWFQQLESQYFPDYDKPDHPTAAIQKQVLEKLPATYRDHPLSRLLAKTGASSVMKDLIIKDLQTKLAKYEGKATLAAKAQPTAQHFTASNGKGGTPFANVSYSAMRNRG